MSHRRLVPALLGWVGLTFGCSHLPSGTPGLPGPHLPEGLPVTSIALPDQKAGAALQAAIDALPETGGILMLPSGVYELERPIELRSNVHLVGSEDHTVLEGLGTGAMVVAAECRDVSLTRLVLDGQNRDKLMRLVLATDCERLGIYRCELRNTGKDANGIELQRNVDQAALIGNHVHDIGNPGDKWGTAITLGWGSSDAVITDNRLEHASRAGLNAHNDCANLYVARNEIRRIRGEALGIELWSNCSGTVEDNVLTARVSFDGSAGTIRRNVVDGASNGERPGFGIEVVHGDGLQVLENRIKGVRMGVSLDKSSRCRLQGNLVEGGETGLQGYGAEAPARDNTLSGNTFRGGSGRALMLNQHCDGWTIEGNVIERYGKSGIYLYGTDDATLTGNTIRYTGLSVEREGEEAAIRWHSDRKTRLVLSGNVLSNNRADYLDVPVRFLPGLGR